MQKTLVDTLLGAALWLCSGLLVIAQSGAQQAAQQRPVFRAGGEYVPVDVVVTDAHDVPITDLKVEEFEIYEGGRRQSIEDFKFVSIPVSDRDLEAIRSAPVVKDVVSNVRLSPDSRLFVLLVDDLHTRGSDIIAVKKAMSGFVRALSPTDEVAVVFAGRPDLNVNFTTDPGRALTAVERTREALGLGDGVGGRDDRATTSDGRAVALAFTTAARALAGSTHLRRAIVYVNGGSTLDRAAPNWTHAVSRELNEAFEVARRADVSIYSLDPGGPLQFADTVRAGTIDAIVRENGSFYVLGYTPSPPLADGGFHPIDVKVTRPGARVRARAGYVSSKAGDPEANLEESMAAAMASGVDMRGLTLRAQVAPLLPFDKAMRSTVTIQVTYPTVSTDLPFDTVKVRVLAIDADGRIRAQSDRGYTFKAPASQRESATFLINEAIDLPAQALTMRIGVSSRALGRTGTIQMPVTVPKPSDAHLQMGAAVIGLTGPARESAFGDDRVRGLVPFQPTTTRQFGQRSTIRVFAPFFWRGRDEVVNVTLTLRSADFEIRREESVKSVSQDQGRQLTTLDTLIPMAKLSGPITMHIKGRLANGQSTEQIVAFDVRPPAGRGFTSF
ncbi:MAG TPA: VWA domain-containing protein [Vicinamibacterales bacterium]|nr:VWA domain-containing protein [Vicinamibacterales bacterium]